MVNANNICLSGKNKTSTCIGDSGGGLHVDVNNEKILIGIVSFGAEAGCEKDYPTVLTFISPYIAWISSKTNLDFL
jgi:secreted trypsin-like serine protease